MMMVVVVAVFGSGRRAGRRLISVLSAVLLTAKFTCVPSLFKKLMMTSVPAIEAVLEKLSSQKIKESLHKKTKEFKELRSLLRNFVLKRESTSLIILGPPGCGKTTLIDAALRALQINSETLPPRILSLNGVFCTDLKSSVLDISRFLRVEVELEGLIGDGTNFENKLEEVLNFLRTVLTSNSELRPLIIILDRMDLFCDHRGQALLYNLFDIVQTRESQLCVIGVTSRVDILELLEKRVKSRFSQRVFQIGSVSFEEYSQFTKNLLTLNGESKRDRGWNSTVEKVLGSNEVEQVIRSLYDFDSTAAAIVNFLYTVLISSFDGVLSSELVSKTYFNIYKSSIVKQALDLSVAEMFMMVAIYRNRKDGNPTFNFTSLYSIVGKSAAETSSLQENDLFEAFLSLADLELITSNEKKLGSQEKHYKSEVTTQEFGEIFKSYPKLPTVFQTFI